MVSQSFIIVRFYEIKLLRNYYEEDIKINIFRVFYATPEMRIQYQRFLTRPRGFEPLRPTLGLEMRGFVVTNSSELHRFVHL